MMLQRVQPALPRGRPVFSLSAADDVLDCCVSRRLALPGFAEPVRDAVLEVDAVGRIASIRGGRDRDAIDLGHVAIVPSLVNAHVHLEFSDLRTPIEPSQRFSSWVRNVVAHRRSRTESVAPILRRGTAETCRTGTIAAGEIATVAPEYYDGCSIDLTLFKEIIGPLPQNWPALVEQAEAHLQCASGDTRNSFCRGISPHAPHTVPQELFEQLIEVAVDHHSPVAVHLAETAEELELLRSGKGDLVEMMRLAWTLGRGVSSRKPATTRLASRTCSSFTRARRSWQLSRRGGARIHRGTFESDARLLPANARVLRASAASVSEGARSRRTGRHRNRRSQFKPRSRSVARSGISECAAPRPRFCYDSGPGHEGRSRGSGRRRTPRSADRRSASEFPRNSARRRSDSDRVPDLFAVPQPQLRVFRDGIELDSFSPG